MKTYTFSLAASALLLFSKGVSAQITLSTADVISPGFTLYYAIDDMPTQSITIGGTGSSAWIFTSAVNRKEDTLIFQAPSATPHSSLFPTANLAAKKGSSNSYDYFVNNSSSLTITGKVIDQFGMYNQNQSYSPGIELLDFPASYPYNNTYTSEGYGKYAYPGAVLDSLENRTTKFTNIYINAYGNMTTTLGTYATLRVTEFTHTIDSVFSHDPTNGWQFMNVELDTTITISWWANGIGFPVAMATVNPATGNPATISWLKSLPVGTGIKKEINVANSFVVFPSPANEYIQIKANQDVDKLNFYDCTGKLCRSISKLETNDRIIISVSDLPTGIYYVFGEQNGSTTTTQKIIITH